MDNLFVPQYKDVEIDAPLTNVQIDQHHASCQYERSDQSISDIQPQTQMKQKLHKFHNQIRSFQRHLIKRQMRVDKFKEDVQNLYWEKSIQHKVQKEIQQQNHWDDMFEQNQARQDEFWSSFGKNREPNQRNEIKSFGSSDCLNDDVLI